MVFCYSGPSGLRQELNCTFFLAKQDLVTNDLNKVDSIPMQKMEAEIRKGKSKTNWKPVYPPSVILLLNKILTDHLLCVRYCVQCWRKAPWLFSRFSGFEPQVPHFLNKDNLTVFSEGINKAAWIKLPRVGVGALPPVFSFHSPLLKLLPSICPCQALSLSWWPQAALPSWGFQVHDYESSVGFSTSSPPKSQHSGSVSHLKTHQAHIS